MTVEIMFKDNSILTIENVTRVSNASTNLTNDWIHVYSMGDMPGHPKFRCSISDIICVETKA